MFALHTFNNDTTTTAFMRLFDKEEVGKAQISCSETADY